MKRLTVVVCLMITVVCGSYGQDVESKEDFINAIHAEIFRTDSKEINLSENCYANRFYTNSHSKVDLKNYIPVQILKQFISKSKIDTLPQQWNCSKISFVKCFNDNSPQPGYSSKTNPIGKFYLSRPIFSKHGDYAIIVMRYTENIKETGCTYVFQNTGWNSWQKILAADCWIYGCDVK